MDDDEGWMDDDVGWMMLWDDGQKELTYGY
jgi:hypothetical protein